jgi:hypothetical protein
MPNRALERLFVISSFIVKDNIGDTNNGREWCVQTLKAGKMQACYVAQHSGQALEVAGLLASQGCQCAQWQSLNHDFQHWKIEDVGGTAKCCRQTIMVSATKTLFG